MLLAVFKTRKGWSDFHDRDLLITNLVDQLRILYLYRYILSLFTEVTQIPGQLEI